MIVSKHGAAKRHFQQLAIVLSMNSDRGSNLKNVPLLVTPRRLKLDRPFSYMTPAEYIASIGKEAGLPDEEIASTVKDAAKGRLHTSLDLREWNVTST